MTATHRHRPDLSEVVAVGEWVTCADCGANFDPQSEPLDVAPTAAAKHPGPALAAVSPISSARMQDAYRGYLDGATTTEDAAADEPWSELGMARRMIARHGVHLRFVPVWRSWLIWDGRRWTPDETAAVARAAKQTARLVMHEAADCADEDLRKVMLRAALRAETAAGQRAIVELAGTEQGVAIAPAELDADPYLLNTATGVLDLRTGAVTAHDPTLHLTKVTGAGYNPDAEAPAFRAFLERVQPDPDMRAFLARLLGYGLLGVVTEHVLPVLHGAGANGKSTLTEAVLGAIGDYGGTVDPGLLVDRGEVHPTGAADLHGMRIAVVHETDENRKLAEGTVKRLTGGDRIKARRMREDFWSFAPSHLLLMLTNHRPAVRGDDEGIWRRLKLVPFDVSIPTAEQDPRLAERLAVEADGVLAWLVAGLTSWRRDGLDTPAAVTDATARYRHDEDAVGRFLDERCLIQPFASVQSAALYGEWCKWCAGEGVPPGTQTAFSITLTNRGHEKRHSAGRMVWRGLGVQSSPHHDQDGMDL